MNKRKWLFVTTPFVFFTIYTYFVSSSFPEYPENLRWLVSLFLGFIILLFIVQRVMVDDNYFIPTMVIVLLVNFVVIFSVDIDNFDNIESIYPVLALLLERPQLILYFCLLMMAVAPPALWNGSFTFYFSRLDYPEENWKDPDFIRANKRISYFWVFVFFLCFLSQLVPMIIVQIFAPIVIVMTLGLYGTKRLIGRFLSQIEARYD
ncbi:MAG: hypothetical protein JJU06_16060 [Ectothiorhodospiraceae bacterium]|nr:hypothetical protein [Ectothiorhodospiraceae bacterium]